MCPAIAASTTVLHPEIRDPIPVSTIAFHESCSFIIPINVIFIETDACIELSSRVCTYLARPVAAALQYVKRSDRFASACGLFTLCLVKLDLPNAPLFVLGRF